MSDIVNEKNIRSLADAVKQLQKVNQAQNETIQALSITLSGLQTKVTMLEQAIKIAAVTGRGTGATVQQ